jgi:hypothetical protein
MLILYPFFYSGATGVQILAQGDLMLVLMTFLTIGTGNFGGLVFDIEFEGHIVDPMGSR